jgi:hypothetical protein
MALTNSLYNALPQLSYIQGFWRFEDNFTDLSTNGYTLTETSGTIPFVTGKIGKAADFEEGDTEYLTIANASCANLRITGNLTISAWIKAESFPDDYCTIVAKYSLNSKRAYMLTLYDTGTGTDKIRFNVSNNGTDFNYIVGGTTLSAGSWYHVCGVYDGTNIYVYLNGSSDAIPVSHATGINNADTPFNVGCRLDGADAVERYFDGLIDEVIIWNTALTANEVKDVYNIQSTSQYLGSSGGMSVCDPMMI